MKDIQPEFENNKPTKNSGFTKEQLDKGYKEIEELIAEAKRRAAEKENLPKVEEEVQNIRIEENDIVHSAERIDFLRLSLNTFRGSIFVISVTILIGILCIGFLMYAGNIVSYFAVKIKEKHWFDLITVYFSIGLFILGILISIVNLVAFTIVHFVSKISPSFKFAIVSSIIISVIETCRVVYVFWEDHYFPSISSKIPAILISLIILILPVFIWKKRNFKKL